MCTASRAYEVYSWTGGLWVARVCGDDGELRPWHFIYVYIEIRMIRGVVYESNSSWNDSSRDARMEGGSLSLSAGVPRS